MGEAFILEGSADTTVFELYIEQILAPSLQAGQQDFPLVRLEGNDPERTNLLGMDLLKDFCCHFLFDTICHKSADVRLGEARKRCTWSWLTCPSSNADSPVAVV